MEMPDRSRTNSTGGKGVTQLDLTRLHPPRDPWLCVVLHSRWYFRMAFLASINPTQFGLVLTVL